MILSYQTDPLRPSHTRKQYVKSMVNKGGLHTMSVQVKWYQETRRKYKTKVNLNELVSRASP